MRASTPSGPPSRSRVSPSETMRPTSSSGRGSQHHAGDGSARRERRDPLPHPGKARGLRAPLGARCAPPRPSRLGARAWASRMASESAAACRGLGLAFELEIPDSRRGGRRRRPNSPRGPGPRSTTPVSAATTTPPRAGATTKGPVTVIGQGTSPASAIPTTPPRAYRARFACAGLPARQAGSPAPPSVRHRPARLPAQRSGSSSDHEQEEEHTRSPQRRARASRRPPRRRPEESGRCTPRPVAPYRRKIRCSRSSAGGIGRSSRRDRGLDQPVQMGEGALAEVGHLQPVAQRVVAVERESADSG